MCQCFVSLQTCFTYACKVTLFAFKIVGQENIQESDKRRIFSTLVTNCSNEGVQQICFHTFHCNYSIPLQTQKVFRVGVCYFFFTTKNYKVNFGTLQFPFMDQGQGLIPQEFCVPRSLGMFFVAKNTIIKPIQSFFPSGPYITPI